MSLLRMRVLLPGQRGVLAELTESLSDVAIVEVRVDHLHGGAVTADMTVQTCEGATRDEIIAAVGRHSPWVQPMPLHAAFNDRCSAIPAVSGGCRCTPEGGGPLFAARDRRGFPAGQQRGREEAA